MITGDNLQTAKSIAFKCGILSSEEYHNEESRSVMGSEHFNISIRDEHGQVRQELIDKVWPDLRVLARAKPIDKYILVKFIINSKISKAREVVAVTGDGTNDGKLISPLICVFPSSFICARYWK